MRRNRLRATILTAMFLAGALTLSLPARAEGAADFYKGKTLTYVVATSPGGGYDYYGRLVARFMEKQVQGTTVIVKNVPGAGHIVGANFIYASKPDGLTIGTFNTGLIYAQLAKMQGLKADLGKMTWIGKASADPRVLVLSKESQLKSWNDIRKAEKIKVSIGGVGSAAYSETMMVTRAFNLKTQIIPGYVGGDSEMAMRRGEIDANLGALSTYDLFVKSGYGIFALQIGGEPMPGVPQAVQLADTPEAKSLIALVHSQAEISRLTAGPPGIPAERTEFLRGIYRKALEDPELREQATKGGDRPVEPLYGEEVAERVRTALAQPPELVAFINEVTAPSK
ncbi:MAG TPA: tripartite tricarboxylate transporter substrate-binding protein [Alphaproteobacteria bacterium]|jgi:tripartite-type tricarboxylate transporter receptor subunit TctC|nr:tripartite tricarboxylate transporter substrate-binding protein [Alphaproteobacteria bacterium]